MTIDNRKESEIYGRLALVAIRTHVTNGNPAELQAAVCYSRAAGYFANRELDNVTWCAPSAAAVINEYGLTQKLSNQILVF